MAFRNGFCLIIMLATLVARYDTQKISIQKCCKDNEVITTHRALKFISHFKVWAEYSKRRSQLLAEKFKTVKIPGKVDLRDFL